MLPPTQAIPNTARILPPSGPLDPCETPRAELSGSDACPPSERGRPRPQQRGNLRAPRVYPRLLSAAASTPPPGARPSGRLTAMVPSTQVIPNTARIPGARSSSAGRSNVEHSKRTTLLTSHLSPLASASLRSIWSIPSTCSTSGQPITAPLVGIVLPDNHHPLRFPPLRPRGPGENSPSPSGSGPPSIRPPVRSDG